LCRRPVDGIRPWSESDESEEDDDEDNSDAAVESSFREERAKVRASTDLPELRRVRRNLQNALDAETIDGLTAARARDHVEAEDRRGEGRRSAGGRRETCCEVPAALARHLVILPCEDHRDSWTPHGSAPAVHAGREGIRHGCLRGRAGFPVSPIQTRVTGAHG
jgi:hypothetical protein